MEQLANVSFVGYYEWKTHPRERVQLIFTEFDLERRSVKARLSNLDRPDWGRPLYEGVWNPDAKDGFEIVLGKHSSGGRPVYGHRDIFGHDVIVWGRRLQLKIMIEGETLYGEVPGGHETLLLSRVDRNRVPGLSGPDVDDVLGSEPDNDGESRSTETPISPGDTLSGKWRLLEWNDNLCPVDQQHTWDFDGAKYSWTRDGSAFQSGTYSQNENGQPYPHLDITLANGREAHGIYRIVGDELRLCVTDVARPRPRIFSMRASGSASVMRLRKMTEQDSVRVAGSSLITTVGN